MNSIDPYEIAFIAEDRNTTSDQLDELYTKHKNDPNVLFGMIVNPNLSDELYKEIALSNPTNNILNLIIIEGQRANRELLLQMVSIIKHDIDIAIAIYTNRLITIKDILEFAEDDSLMELQRYCSSKIENLLSIIESNQLEKYTSSFRVLELANYFKKELSEAGVDYEAIPVSWLPRLVNIKKQKYAAS